MIGAAKLIRLFCKTLFEARDPEGALLLLSENVVWVDASGSSPVLGRSGIRPALQRALQRWDAPCTLSFSGQRALPSDADAAELMLRLCDGVRTRAFRVTATAVHSAGCDQIAFLHAAETADAPVPAAVDPYSLCRTLINSAAMGAVLGAYPDENLSFYTANARALHMLGYADAAEFGRELEHRLINALHPDDRARVREDMKRQIDLGGACALEFRLRRRDGTSLWVHAGGQCAVTPEGQKVLILFCRDISSEREHNRLFDQLLNFMKGGVAIYQIENGNARAEYVSPGVAAILGMDVDEYCARYGNDIVSSICASDRAKMIAAVREVLREGEPKSLTYCSPHKNGSCVWVNGLFSRHVSGDDAQYLRAVFTPASREFEAQLQILDLTRTGIYIVDRETCEMYYCNAAMFRMLNVAPCDYTGRRCHELLFRRDDRCAFCKLFDALRENAPQELFLEELGRYYSVNARNTQWNGRPSVIAYVIDITEIRTAQEQLRRSEEITEAASDFAGLWLWTYDVLNNTACAYRKLREDFGLPEQLSDYPDSWLKLDFIAPEYHELYRENVQKIRDGAACVEFDCKTGDRNGSVHWIRCRFNTLTWRDGRPALAVCTSQLIDVEKSLEARVTLEERKPLANQKLLLAGVVANLSRNSIVSHRVFRKNAPVPAGGQDYDGAIAAAAEFIPDAAQRARFLELHDRARLMERFVRGETSDAIQFRRHMPGGGRLLWVKYTLDLLRNPSNGDTLLYEYGYDVDLEKKSRLAVDSLVGEEVDFIALVNVESGRGRLIRGREALLNDARWQDYAHEAVTDALISGNIVPEDRARCAVFLKLRELQARLEREGDISVTYTRRVEGEAEQHKKLRAFCLDETRTDIVIARRDVTDLFMEERRQKRALEQALDAANQASRAKGSFLSQMSHEIRTPMNAIMGMTKLAEEAVRNPEVLDYLQKIDAASDYLLHILNDVLDMSRIESGRMELAPEWVSARALLDSCIGMQLSAAQARGIQFNYPDTHAMRGVEYYVDPLRTKQIFMNLLSNAIKFTEPGGSVTLHARAISHDAEVSCEEISISDTGRGMSEEFLTRIFTPFEQERAARTDAVQGTGLGLALVKSIVTAMGGSIAVESRPGEGSTFTVTLRHRYRVVPVPEEETLPAGAAREEADGRGNAAPRRDVDAREGAEPCDGADASEAAPDFRGRRFLLVDDHPLNREIGGKLLAHRGAQIELACDGLEAVSRFASAEPGRFDAVLMDIRMPVMDGLEAARRIRALDRDDARRVPIIAMTANAFEEDVRLSVEAGMNAHLAKPINPKCLYQTIAEQLARASAERR